MRKLALLLPLLTALETQAAYYTEEPDPDYQKVTTTIFCMNHFYNRTTGFLGHPSGMAAQKSLASMLENLKDKEKTADAIRMATNAINEKQTSHEVPYTCFEYIPKDHGLKQEELEYFLLNSSDKNR